MSACQNPMPKRIYIRCRKSKNIKYLSFDKHLKINYNQDTPYFHCKKNEEVQCTSMASEGTGKRKNCDKWKMGRRVACCRVHRGIVEADKEWQNPD